MTNKQSWVEEFDKKFPRPYQGDYRGLHTATKNFIRQLLTSKSEQMEEEKKNCPAYALFDEGISKCQEILKK